MTPGAWWMMLASAAVVGAFVLGLWLGGQAPGSEAWFRRTT